MGGRKRERVNLLIGIVFALYLCCAFFRLRIRFALAIQRSYLYVNNNWNSFGIQSSGAASVRGDREGGQNGQNGQNKRRHCVYSMKHTD